MQYLSTDAGDLLQTEDGYLLQLIVEDAITPQGEKPLRTLMRMAKIDPRRRKMRRLRATKPSHAAELAYRADLMKIVAVMRQQLSELLPVIRDEAKEFTRQATTDEFSVGRLVQAINRIVRTFGNIDAVAERMAAEAVRRQEAVTNRQLATAVAEAMGDRSLAVSFRGVVESLSVRPKIEAAIVNNAELIKTMPAQFVEKVKGIVLNGATQGRRYEDIARDLQKQIDISENRARFIARDQMASLNAAITEAKQTALGITEYEWVTAGDERVRAEHVAQNGRVFRWNDPPGTGHPGEDFNCRCIARPIIKFNE